MGLKIICSKFNSVTLYRTVEMRIQVETQKERYQRVDRKGRFPDKTKPLKTLT